MFRVDVAQTNVNFVDIETVASASLSSNKENSFTNEFHISKRNSKSSIKIGTLDLNVRMQELTEMEKSMLDGCNLSVHLQLHEITNEHTEALKSLEISVLNKEDGSPLMRFALPNDLSPSKLCFVQIVDHKCTAESIAESRKKATRAQPKTKKRRKNLNNNFMNAESRFVKNKFQDLEVSELKLAYNSEQNVFHLETTISLLYVVDAFNKFANETRTFLDHTFCHATNDAIQKDKVLHLNTNFIERYFIHQTINYSKVRLRELNQALESLGLQIPINLPNLNVTLMPFQRDSVQWMLNKEGYYPELSHESGIDGTYDDKVLEFLNDKVSYGYVNLNSEVYWNKFSCYMLSMEEAKKIYESFSNDRQKRASGLLSEEMGLGKTIEILSLILLNKRKEPDRSPDGFLSLENRRIKKVATTLIICPNSILQQWLNEIQMHTENLTVFHYKGFLRLKSELKTESIPELVDLLSQYDIILTTYSVVASEVHYAQYSVNTRPRRNEQGPKYDYSSPLSLMEFMRIILDEVQMLRSDSTKAAQCTSLLHRLHTWGVSGTPVHKISDFQTIWYYLQIHPFVDIPLIINIVDKHFYRRSRRIQENYIIPPGEGVYDSDYDQLIHGVRITISDLLDIFMKYDLCIRHSKSDVASQINIPEQHNYLIELEFAPVEWDNYLDLWENFLSISRFSPDGSGTTRLSNNQLNSWLEKLRYTCCHAVIPEYYNVKKVHGKSSHSSKGTTLYNMQDILKFMTYETQEKLDSLRRENYQLLIRSAQCEMELHENIPGAILILEDVKIHLLEILSDKFHIENALNSELATLHDYNARDWSEDTSNEISALTESSIKSKLISYFELLHQCFFFTATAYYMLGTKKLEDLQEEEKADETDLTINHKKTLDNHKRLKEEEMANLRQYQIKEDEYYTTAEKLREMILFTQLQKVTETIDSIKSALRNNKEMYPVDLRILKLYANAKLTSNFNETRLFSILEKAMNQLNDQSLQFNELMGRLLDIAYKPIIKEYDGSDDDKKAEEYATSIKEQDEIFSILASLELLLQNRETFIQSEEELILPKRLIPVDQDVSEYYAKLLSQLKLVSGTTLKSVFMELRNVQVIKTISAQHQNKRNSENFIEHMLSYENLLPELLTENRKIRESIKKINTIYNTKLEYYSDLQKISDSLISLKELDTPSRNGIIRSVKGNVLYQQNLSRIATIESRYKYLSNLMMLQNTNEENKDIFCTICLGQINTGAMLKCGHYFCQRCILSWLRTRSTCPICKIDTNVREIYTFRFRNESESDKMMTRDSVYPGRSENTRSPGATSTRSILSQKYTLHPDFDDINRITIKDNFGSKIDFIIKSILFIRLKDESRTNLKSKTQIVLYSQNYEFLSVISKVLDIHGIKHLTTMNNTANVGNKISQFKTNSDITCLLLNVKTLGAGLNLFNAQHIFLLDPIINQGDELQAMSRNNRIGQTRETFVWNFMIKNSVEENILTYKCILEGQKYKALTGTALDREIERAFDLNESTGEEVSSKHLWYCFFCATKYA